MYYRVHQAGVFALTVYLVSGALGLDGTISGWRVAGGGGGGGGREGGLGGRGETEGISKSAKRMWE